MRNSLFLKIYLTLLSSLAFVAVASGVYVHIGQDRDAAGWLSRRDAFLEAMLPADSGPGPTRETLRRLSRAFDADITIYGRDGRPLDSAGRPVPPGGGGTMRMMRREGTPQPFTMQLGDGRTLAVRLRQPFGPEGRSPLAYLVLIAGVIGLAAYPVVRHLTRRLETLRLGVQSWGDGALDTRVSLSGKDEVAAVAASFNLAAERVEKLLESNRSLLANASHELRSPLARLRMAVDLEEGADTPRKAEIVRNLAELDGLVEEILLASRLDHADRLERAEAIDLLALVAEEGARSGVPVTGVPAMIEGDPTLLTRLVRNLMQNALRHGGPPVSAEVAREGGSVLLRVRDHGPGLPDEVGDRVFEPFFRPAGRSETAGGWGLGLALVRQIAIHHGADVHHQNPPGGGAMFVVRFVERGQAGGAASPMVDDSQT
jgi:two-component system OmpR family sensor kinase